MDQGKKRKKRPISTNSSSKKRTPNEKNTRESNRNRDISSKKKSSKQKRYSGNPTNKRNSNANRKPTSGKRKTSSKNKKPPTFFDQKVKPILKSVLNVAFYVFIIVVVFTAIMFNFNDDQTKSFFGFRIMTVKTNSMAPKKDTTYKDGFKAGALIILKKEDKNNLKVGDIITYMPSLSKSSAYLTHRVIEVKDELNGTPGRYYVTKGDFNDVDDSPIIPDQYVGTVVFSAPQVGVIIQFVQNNIFVVLLLALAVFCFYVTLRYYLSMPN